MATTHYRIIAAAWLALASITSAADDGSSANLGDGDSSNSGDAKSASQDNPVQTPVTPFNLSIDAPVQLAGSDAASKEFQNNVLPGMLKVEQEQQQNGKSESQQSLASSPFDPSKLVLNTDSTARMYFLGDGTGNQNTLGISNANADAKSAGASLILPISSNSSDAANALRAAGQSLQPGDFLDLGTLKAGSSLDFFLIASGAADGNWIVSNDKSLNKDGMLHATAMATPGSPYLIISFDEKGGNGEDGKVFFAVDFGNSDTAKVANLAGLGAPEPSLALGALLIGGALLGFSRRRVA
ncbi:MAG: hypothetical protein WCJ66_08185 [Verrucomicrobiota bacterium]